MTSFLAIACAVVTICLTPVFARKGIYQKTWESLGRTKNQGFFLPKYGINLKINVTVISLSDYDSKTSSLAVNYWIVMFWNDPTARWNATAQGVNTIRVPAHMLWTPDIVPFTFKTHRKDFNTYAVVNSDGTVIYVPAFTTRVTCKDRKAADSKNVTGRSDYVRKQCVLKLGSWVFDGLSLNISSYGVDLGNLDITALSGSGWDFNGLKTKFVADRYPCCKEPYLSYSLKINIQQNSTSVEGVDEEKGSWLEEVEEVEEGEGLGIEEEEEEEEEEEDEGEDDGKGEEVDDDVEAEEDEEDDFKV